MMATLNVSRFSMCISIWLFPTLNFPNAPDASHEINLCQGHQINIYPFISSSMESSLPYSFLFGESETTSNHEPKRNKMKSKKKKQKQRGNQPIVVSHARGKILATSSHARSIDNI